MQSTRLFALVLLVLVVAACSDGGPSDPAALLATAAERLDSARSVSIAVESADLPAGSSALVSAEGVIERPDAFAGTVEARVAGVTADIEVLSVDGTFYARLPFTDSLAATDPALLGFGDPAALLDPDTGISRLLTEAEDGALGEAGRTDGEVVDVVTAAIPGDLVAELLTSADPSTPVEAVLRIARDTGELRQVVLTGPFYEADVLSSYTVTLTGYDEPVTIPTPPDGG